MNKNSSFQRKEYLVLRELIHRHAKHLYIEGYVWDNEWMLPIMRDYIHQDDLPTDFDYGNDQRLFCTFDWKKISNYEWALPVIEKNIDRVDWTILSRKPWAKHLIDANPDKVVHSSLFANPTMMNWIDAHMNEVVHDELCLNSAAMHLIGKLELVHLNWDNLCQNSNALPFLENNKAMINWKILSNQEWALSLLTKYPDTHGIDWYSIADKPWAIDLIEKNLHRLIYYNPDSLWRLEENPAADNLILKNRQIFTRYDDGRVRRNAATYVPAYIDDLYANPSLIDWTSLESNAAAIHLIEERLRKGKDCISNDIWMNPSIITYNYEKIKSDRSWLREGLIQHFYQPAYLDKWLSDNLDKEIEDYNPCAF